MVADLIGAQFHAVFRGLGAIVPPLGGQRPDGAIGRPVRAGQHLVAHPVKGRALGQGGAPPVDLGHARAVGHAAVDLCVNRQHVDHRMRRDIGGQAARTAAVPPQWRDQDVGLAADPIGLVLDHGVQPGIVAPDRAPGLRHLRRAHPVPVAELGPRRRSKRRTALFGTVMRLRGARKVPGLGAVFDIDMPGRGHQRPDQRGALADVIVVRRSGQAQPHVGAHLVAQGGHPLVRHETVKDLIGRQGAAGPGGDAQPALVGTGQDADPLVKAQRAIAAHRVQVLAAKDRALVGIGPVVAMVQADVADLPAGRVDGADDDVDPTGAVGGKVELDLVRHRPIDVRAAIDVDGAGPLPPQAPAAGATGGGGHVVEHAGAEPA